MSRPLTPRDGSSRPPPSTATRTARKPTMTTRHTLHLFGLAGLGALLVTPALAQDDSYNYVGASIGQSRARIDEAGIASQLQRSGLSMSSITSDEKDTAYKLFGGRQFNRHFAVEGGYFNLGQFGFRSTTSPAGTLDGQIKLHGLNLDLVGTLPLTQKLSAIGRVGAQYASARDTFSGTGSVVVLDPSPSKKATNLKFGAGLQYAFSPSMLLRGEVERYRVDDAVGHRGDVNMFSVSLVIPFGRAPTAAPMARAAPVAPAPPPVAVAVAPAPAPAPAPVAVPIVLPTPAPAPQRVTIYADSLFSFDHSDMRPEGRAALDRFVQDLSGTRYDTITVEGHTDRMGSPTYNQALSLRRAESVKGYLVSSGGLDGAKLSTVGRGETAPVTRPEECRDVKPRAALIGCLQPDRRVEVEVTGTR
jgi:OmpA-OmpF porin, OOP family